MLPEVLASPFMQKAFIAGALVAVLGGLISAFIVLRKMSFIGAGISHAAFGGVAIGFITGTNPLISAVLYTIAVAVGIDITVRRGRISEDVSIGIFYSVSMALGVVLIGLSKGYNVDLFGYLFGNILAITDEEIALTLAVSAAASAVILAFLKEFFLITYSEELAEISGIRVRALNTLFLVALSVSIVIAIRIVGIILVSALLVIPGATARLFARGLLSMIGLSCLFALISVMAGLLISYHMDVAPGGAIVLTAAAVFFLPLLLKKRG